MRLVLAATFLAVVGSVFGGALLTPTGTRAVGPLPACRYDDLLTSPRGYGDWPMTLVDTILSVTKTYVPPDLVSVSEAGLSGDGMVRALVIDDLRAMRVAAAAAGAPFAIESAYRSFSEQQQVFDAFVKQYGYDRALMTPARPGHSEHQLGVAIDFRSAGATGTGNFGSTPAGRWLAIHAWQYGFVMSYPKGLTTVTCYDSEPWHFRYVGRALAADIHASGETVREYLWTNFTNTVVPPAPHSSGPPIAPLPSLGPTQASGAPGASDLPGPGQTVEPSMPSVSPNSSVVAPPGSPIPSAATSTDPIDPAVAAGALPILVVIAAITFTLIIGGGWLASRRKRPDAGSAPRR